MAAPQRVVVEKADVGNPLARTGIFVDKRPYRTAVTVNLVEKQVAVLKIYRIKQRDLPDDEKQ